VGNRQASSQAGAVAAIEKVQLYGRIVAQTACNASPNVLADPRGAEPLAFKAQVGDLIEGIDCP
jgi:hypothetical protein